jgi:hypothetical protein
VNVTTRAGRQALLPAEVFIAEELFGPRPPAWRCDVCGALFHYTCVQNGSLIPWAFSLEALAHGLTCLDRLMREFPIHSERDPIGSQRRTHMRGAASWNHTSRPAKEAA